MIPTADALEVELFPTAYFRYERRDLSCPTMVLQQWWCDKHSNLLLRSPEECGTGLWRDVPIVQGPPQFIDPEKERIADELAYAQGFISKKAPHVQVPS